MPAILAKQGVTSEMRFCCSDCGDVINGAQIHDGAYLFIVKKNPNDPLKSLWRCECCQAEHEESDGD